MISVRLAIFQFLIWPAKLWIHVAAFLIGARFIERPVSVQQDDPPWFGGNPNGER